MIPILSYIAISFLVARKLAWHALNNWHYEKEVRYYVTRKVPFGPTRSVLTGFFLGAIWPLMLAGFGLGAVICALQWTTEKHNGFWRRIFIAEPSEARRQRKREALQGRIAELEKELGMVDSVSCRQPHTSS